MAASKAAKAGAWAGAATLATALAAAAVQMRPVIADWRLSDGDRAQLREIGAHAIDKPVRFEVIGTSRGVVELAVFETGCVRVASANRLRYLAAPEHEVAAVPAVPARPLAAGLFSAGAPPCRAPADGQCAIPPDHPTWIEARPMRSMPDGSVLMHLIFADGDVLEAIYNPQNGAFSFTRFLCCSH